MDPGDAFRTGTGHHLCIVLSDPKATPEEVVIVTVTSCRNERHDDPACILNCGDHPFIRHPSFVGYDRARITTNRELDQKLSAGTIILEGPISHELLLRIRCGADLSDRIPIEVHDALRNQGLLDTD